jgi:hypothetical protein
MSANDTQPCVFARVRSSVKRPIKSLTPSAYIKNSRKHKLTYIKSDTGKILQNIVSRFKFHLDLTNLKTALHNIVTTFVFSLYAERACEVCIPYP